MMDLRTQKYKICINNSWLVLIDYKQRDQLDSKAYPVFLLLQSPDTNTILNTMRQLLDHTLQLPVIVCCKRPKSIWNLIQDTLTPILAAGGIVQNPTGKYLFIHRRGWWDLPKGKIEKGESTKIAALREVKEEVGLECDILCTLPPTYHVYEHKKDLILKKTSWYLMRAGSSRPKLQKEEDIIGHAWKSMHQLGTMQSKVYPNLSILLENLKYKLKEISLI